MWHVLRYLVICWLFVCAGASFEWAQLATDDCFSEAGRDSEKAIRYCTAVIDTGRLTDYELVHSLNSRGWAYYQEGDYDKAIQDYNRAIQLKPDYAFAFNNRGLAYSRERDYDRAIRDYDEAIRLKPDYPQAFGNRGLAYASKGEENQAIQNFNQAIKLREDSPEVFYNRGKVYAGQAHFDQAIKDYSQAIRLKPDYAEAFKERSEAFMYKYDYQSALRDINWVIELRPNDADAISSRGSFYYQKRDYDRAIRDFSQAIQLKPEKVFTFWLRAAAYYDKGDYEAAIRDYNEVIKVQPEVNVKNVSEIYQRGLAYLYKGDYEGATRDFNEVADLKLSWGFYHRGLARFFMGHYGAAKEDFARSGEGPYSDIWMYLAGMKTGEKATEELKEKAPRISEQLKYWPGPVIQYYLGSLTPAQVLAAARADDLADKNPCNCDDSKDVLGKVHLHYSEGSAYFYFGENMLVRGRSAEAKPLFQKAASMASKNSEEYHAAVLELSLLSATAPKKSVSK